MLLFIRMVSIAHSLRLSVSIGCYWPSASSSTVHNLLTRRKFNIPRFQLYDAGGLIASILWFGKSLCNRNGKANWKRDVVMQLFVARKWTPFSKLHLRVVYGRYITYVLIQTYTTLPNGFNGRSEWFWWHKWSCYTINFINSNSAPIPRFYSKYVKDNEFCKSFYVLYTII